MPHRFCLVLTPPTHPPTQPQAYLSGYSHWSYTDLDLVAGDLPAFFSREELADFDLVTLTFGDVVTHGRLYLRGQFAMHKISRATSRLWLGCDFLGPPTDGGGGLLHELRLKAVLYERANQKGEPFRPHFNSAEGCYSAVVTSQPELRVKYANKVKGAAAAGPNYPGPPSVGSP